MFHERTQKLDALFGRLVPADKGVRKFSDIQVNPRFIVLHKSVLKCRPVCLYASLPVDL
jgi:hypothetical protein